MKRMMWFVAVLMMSFCSVGALAAKKLTSRSYLDARACLDLPTNTEIIKCAEKYL